MQQLGDKVLFSAGDLIAFLECEHATALSLQNLVTPLPRATDDESLQLIQEKGFAHEATFLDSLKSKNLRIVELPSSGSPEQLARETLDAMRAGPDVIFQAALIFGQFYGRADFLRRVEEPSSLGTWRYEAADTKLARSPKAKFIVQLGFYSNLISEAQGADPKNMHLVLGGGEERSYRVANFSRYIKQVQERFMAFTASQANQTYPERCSHCPFCPWRNICEERWIADDHLNQVAGLTRNQAKRLTAAGIGTLESLARTEPTFNVPRLHHETLEKLRAQAALQLAKRQTGESKIEVLPLDPERRRGFYRLPQPDEGDVFFDMEGDPFEDGGLEYLFGLVYVDNGSLRFQAFWAHDRAEERRAFEALMDFLTERLARYPHMHIYHYAHYELKALQRLMSLHGTREAQVDDLLRRGVLIDLYKVVRQGIRTSEAGLSLKDIERFFMPPRAGEVTTAGASIVYYERWRISREPSELEKIRSYNEDDCRATYALRNWLVKMRPEGMPWYSTASVEKEGEERAVSTKVIAIEAELARYREKLLFGLPTNEMEWDADAHLRKLVFDLLDFHRRCAKPEWWAMFARQDVTEEELIDDVECLGGLRIVPEIKPESVARSFIYTFSYPEQETKLRAGKECLRADNAQRLGSIVSMDETSRLVRIKVNARLEVPSALSIGPSGPISTEKLRLALLRFADAFIAGNGQFKALLALLRKELPRLSDRVAGTPIIEEDRDIVEQSIHAVLALQESTLFIQGPPGAGKTYTGSHIIAELLRQGKRIAISSNSHKAINHLLGAVEKVAEEREIRFFGVKKSNSADPDSQFEGNQIHDVGSFDEVLEADAQLVAGTAWLFAEPDLEGYFDYLFVDEAGQVALANFVAMGTSARNIVLLGDQMQLGQPIQGVHPGHSGESTLDYLLDGLATIPPERGIFLPTSWRMHEDVCRFISDAVYDSRLHPEPANQTQRLILDSKSHRVLCPTGIVFLPVEHDGCAQRSAEEAEVIKALYLKLLDQRFRDKKGNEHEIGFEDVMVIAPYNSQVNLLKSVLPPGARVGTIDKFQGQESEAVLISMTTSSGEYLPRNIEFLYDKNRLNVAISRAKCLAVVVASPALLNVKCTTPEQMELVNTLCWVNSYSKEQH